MLLLGGEKEEGKTRTPINSEGQSENVVTDRQTFEIGKKELSIAPDSRKRVRTDDSRPLHGELGEGVVNNSIWQRKLQSTSPS